MALSQGANVLSQHCFTDEGSCPTASPLQGLALSVAMMGYQIQPRFPAGIVGTFLLKVSNSFICLHFEPHVTLMTYNIYLPPSCLINLYQPLYPLSSHLHESLPQRIPPSLLGCIKSNISGRHRRGR